MCIYACCVCIYNPMNVSSESVFLFQAVCRSPCLCIKTMYEKCLLCNRDLLNTTFISYEVHCSVVNHSNFRVCLFF